LFRNRPPDPTPWLACDASAAPASHSIRSQITQVVSSGQEDAKNVMNLSMT